MIDARLLNNPRDPLREHAQRYDAKPSLVAPSTKNKISRRLQKAPQRPPLSRATDHVLKFQTRSYRFRLPFKI